MLDTNTLDYIYNKQVELGSKLTKPPGTTLNFYITYVQHYEINKIADVSKKNAINKLLKQIGIKTILPSEISEYLQFDFINTDDYKNEMKRIPFDPNDFKKIFEYNSSQKVDFADFLILRTAIKNKMDFLITDNIADFQPLLKKFYVMLPNSLLLKKNCELDCLCNYN